MCPALFSFSSAVGTRPSLSYSSAPPRVSTPLHVRNSSHTIQNVCILPSNAHEDLCMHLCTGNLSLLDLIMMTEGFNQFYFMIELVIIFYVSADKFLRFLTNLILTLNKTKMVDHPHIILLHLRFIPNSPLDSAICAGRYSDRYKDSIRN